LHIASRSSTLLKHKLVVQSAVIDNGYRGELFITVWNSSQKTLVAVPRGQRLAQLVPFLIVDLEWQECVDLPGGDRGVNGIGSTGE
jgi:dUTP pyrophosphatase